MQFHHFPLIWETATDLRDGALSCLREHPGLIGQLLLSVLLQAICFGLMALTLLAYFPLYRLFAWLSLPALLAGLAWMGLVIVWIHLLLLLNLLFRYLADLAGIVLMARLMGQSAAWGDFAASLLRIPAWSWTAFRWQPPDSPSPLRLFQNSFYERYHQQQAELLMAFPRFALGGEDPRTALEASRSEIEADWSGVTPLTIAFGWYFWLGCYLAFGAWLLNLAWWKELNFSYWRPGEAITAGILLAWFVWIAWGRFERLCFQLSLYCLHHGRSESVPYPDFLPEAFLTPLP